MEIIQTDVMTYNYPLDFFDTVACRGAFEHFTDDEQSTLVSKIKQTLKKNGWFAGDTNKKTGKGEFHGHEFSSEEEIREWFKKFFDQVNVYSFAAKGEAPGLEGRVTYFWQCR